MTDDTDGPKLIHNEQLKLAATLFNNVAVAFIVTGFVVPIVALAYQAAPPRGRYWVISHPLGKVAGFVPASFPRVRSEETGIGPARPRAPRLGAGAQRHAAV